MAKASYDFDDYLAEARPTDFVLKVKGKEIAIPAPTAEDLIALDEATTARATLEILLGEHYDEVWDLIKGKHKGVLEKLMKDVQKHFGLLNEPQGGGRPSSR